jgi:hypothetical protein
VLKVSGELLTKSKIADALGTNPMRVTRFIERNKINAVKKEGKRELFKLTDFNALKKELDDPEAKKEAQSHAFSKDEYILTLKKQLEDQQEQFNKMLQAKDETIDSLKETIATSKHAYEDMKDQLAVKDDQISSLTKLTNNAQTLNLLDKPKKAQDTATTGAETSNERSSSDDSQNESSKKHWWQRFTRDSD